MDLGEIRLLAWKHIARQKAVVVAPRAKTGVHREIPLDGALGRILAEEEAVRGISNLVFLDDAHQPPHAQAVKSAMRRAWAKACPTKTRPWKSLRATFATRLNSQGTTVPTIASLMGLTSAYVLDFYILPGEEEKRQAMLAVDGARNTGGNTEAQAGANPA